MVFTLVAYMLPLMFAIYILLRGILMCVRQLENGDCTVQNAYGRYVKPEGNRAAHRSTVMPWERWTVAA